MSAPREITRPSLTKTNWAKMPVERESGVFEWVRVVAPNTQAKYRGQSMQRRWFGGQREGVRRSVDDYFFYDFKLLEPSDFISQPNHFLAATTKKTAFADECCLCDMKHGYFYRSRGINWCLFIQISSSGRLQLTDLKLELKNIEFDLYEVHRWMEALCQRAASLKSHIPHIPQVSLKIGLCQQSPILSKPVLTFFWDFLFLDYKYGPLQRLHKLTC